MCLLLYRSITAKSALYCSVPLCVMNAGQVCWKNPTIFSHGLILKKVQVRTQNSPFGHDEMKKAWRCSTQVLLVVLITITFAGFTSLWIAVHNVAPPPSRGRTPVQPQLSEQQRQAVEQPQAAPPQQPPHQHQAEDVCLSDTVYKCHTEHGNGTQYMAWDVHRGTCVDFKPRTRAGEVL